MNGVNIPVNGFAASAPSSGLETENPYAYFTNSLGGKITDALGITNFQGGSDAWETWQNRLYEEQKINNARQWDIYYDSTKYQRAVEDLKKAGLNPWLAVQSGLSGGSSYNTTPESNSGKQVSSKSNDASSLMKALALMLIASAKMMAL